MKNNTVLFASAVPARVEGNLTLPAKFERLLKQLIPPSRLKGKTVAVKMHLGGNYSFSTIHPLFVRLLVDHIRKGGPRRVFVTDAALNNPERRGYTRETLGAEIVGALGRNEKDVVRKKTGWKHLPEALISRRIADADVLVNLSHVKAHGDCGFGGACKNLAMGCVPSKTRQGIHSLEGNLTWTRARCIRCNKCIEACPTGANKFNAQGEYHIFWHHCRMCLHCMLVCPEKAIKIVKPKFDLMQEGLARIAKVVLDSFNPSNVFHINVLMQITIFCDCWGLTTPSLVPDIGILAGRDIVAVDHASLDAIKVKNLIPGSITPPFILGKGNHLFERIHRKNPYIQVEALERIGAGKSRHQIREID